MHDRRLAKSTQPWTCRGPSLSVRLPTPTASKRERATSQWRRMPWESKRDWATVALGLVARFCSRMQVPARDVRTELSARRAVLDGGERSLHVRYAGAASLSLTTASGPA